MVRTIMESEVAASHGCIDFGGLRGLLDSDRPLDGTEERRRFMKIVKEALRFDPACRKGSGI